MVFLEYERYTNHSLPVMTNISCKVMRIIKQLNLRDILCGVSGEQESSYSPIGDLNVFANIVYITKYHASILGKWSRVDKFSLGQLKFCPPELEFTKC